MKSVVLGLFFFLACLDSGKAQDLTQASIGSSIAAILNTQSTTINGIVINQAVLNPVYQARQYQPAWLDRSGAPTDTAKTAIVLLEQADQEGLTPTAYHIDQIETAAKPSDPSTAAAFDLLLSDGLGAYLHDIAVGRTPIGAERDASFNLPFDEGLVLNSVIPLSSDDLKRLLSGLAPTMADYAALKQALVVLKQWVAVGGWPALLDGPSLKPGMTSKDVIALRQRLQIPTGAKPQFYDDDVTNAVKSFQQWHAIKDDGAVGKDTRVALNMSAQDRIAEVIAAMERLRWLPRQFPPRYVMVNVGGFWVRLYNDNQITVQLPIIVGRTERKTPMLESAITNVIINPTWTVPPTIIRKEVLPAMRKNLGYLAGKGINLYRRTDTGLEQVNPLAIDWQDRSSLNDYVLRQPAGDENPLGHYKFNFPNPYSIYLHDTPEQKKFEAALRTFSSGCVRVQNAQQLAETILGEENVAAPDKIAALRADEKTHWLKLDSPIPIYIIYTSVWLDQQGHLIFGPDLYEKDAALAAALGSATP